MKPEDIPQEVLEAATIAFDKTGVTRGGYHMCVDIIARAIMAAAKRGEEREREACASAVEDYQPDLKTWDGPTERSVARMATDYAVIDIAAAIRNRGKP